MNDMSDDDPATISRLLAKVGRRAQPPGETREAVYFSTLAAWQLQVQRRRRRRVQWFALAASLGALAIALVWYGTTPPDAPLVAATQSDSGIRVVVGEILQVSDPPGIVLRAAAGERLRIASGTVLQFKTATTVELLSGQMYVETAGTTADRALVVQTRFGTVHHVGTRYAVAISRDAMSVSVRDGLVAVTTREGRHEAGAHMRVVFDSNGRESSRLALASYGPEWAWAESLAPALQIEGRRLADVLQDIAVETGRRLEFDDDKVRRSCEQITLKGPYLEMPAADRLFAVLITTGLEAVENEDRILIREQSD